MVSPAVTNHLMTRSDQHVAESALMWSYFVSSFQCIIDAQVATSRPVPAKGNLDGEMEQTERQTVSMA